MVTSLPDLFASVSYVLQTVRVQAVHGLTPGSELTECLSALVMTDAQIGKMFYKVGPSVRIIIHPAAPACLWALSAALYLAAPHLRELPCRLGCLVKGLPRKALTHLALGKIGPPFLHTGKKSSGEGYSRTLICG